MIYAAAAGARVVAAAVGSINNSRFAQQAVDYGYTNGVVIMASAADENSLHHNYPSNYDQVVTVKAIVPNSYLPPLEHGLAPFTTTFLQHSGCANYGGRMDLSFPTESCSSGATGLAGGLGALIISRGLDLVDQGILKKELSSEEVKQIITLSADDVFEPRSMFYHSQFGWDQYYGYGRANAKAAVERIGQGTIPPEADLRNPGWFETLNPVKTPVVEIVGRAAANRAGSYLYVVAYGIGIEPLERKAVCLLEQRCYFIRLAGSSTFGATRRTRYSSSGRTGRAVSTGSGRRGWGWDAGDRHRRRGWAGFAP